MSRTSAYAEWAAAHRYRPDLFFANALDAPLSDQQLAIAMNFVKPQSMTAVKSATGTGKTFTVAGLILHQLLVEPDVKQIATAPSAGQLRRGIKAEVLKLHRKLPSFLADLLEPQTDQIIRKSAPDNFCSYVSADTDNKESLAGVHAARVNIFNDEASALSDDAYETLWGNLTTETCSMLQISNPVRPDGKFRQLWIKKPKHWKLFTLDAFGSPFVSQKWIDMVREEYGEDSDFYRMRVLGDFPRTAEDIFFDADEVDAAFERILPDHMYMHFPRIMGVDVARFGSDCTVFVVRQGPKILDVRTYQGLDTELVAGEVMAYQHLMGCKQINIDGIGIGAGVYDKLKHQGLPVLNVEVNRKSSDPQTYYNLRSQLYGEFKRWIKNGADLYQSETLRQQMMSIRYSYNAKLQMQLIGKIDLKKRYKVESPDEADACSLTFYEEAVQHALPKLRAKKKRIKRRRYGYVV